jgi:hypothetical protein
MTRARRLFFRLMIVAIALLVSAVWISQDRYDAVYSVGLLRLVVIAATLGAAAATWGTAVMIASVHRIVWPLIATTLAVVGSLASIAVFWHLVRAPGW